MDDDEFLEHPGSIQVRLDDNGHIILTVPDDGIRLRFDPANALKIAGYIAHGAYKAQGLQCSGVTILPLETPPPQGEGPHV